MAARKEVIHKREVASDNDGSGLMGLFFISWNGCGAGIRPDNQNAHDWKLVTCKKCLKLKKGKK